MDRTEATIRKLLAALPAPGYDIGVLSEGGMYRVEAAPASRVLRMLPYLKHRNANGAHIYIRPTGESPYTLLDDLTAASLPRLTAEGYAPAAVVETSPGSFQAWLRHPQPLSKELGTLAAKTLAEQFGADGSAADWRRFGRAPGFTNRKPQHRNAQGLYPFARLVSHTGQPFAAAEPFRTQLLATQQQIEQQRAALRLSFAARPLRFPRPSRSRASARRRATRTASRRRYGLQHRRLRSGLGRARHRRRPSPRLPLPRHQQGTTERLHPAHPLQSASLGRLKNRAENPLRVLPSSSRSFRHAPVRARAEAVPSSDSSLAQPTDSRVPPYFTGASS